MLDEKDLQAISQLMDTKLSKQKEEILEVVDAKLAKQKDEILEVMDVKLAKQKDEILDESTHRMNVLLETKVQTQLNLLAEGQKTILETLAPKNRVEELEEEVSFLKSVIRLHTDQIAELKKAQ